MRARKLFAMAGLLFTGASATLPNYLWRHAPVGFQNVNGISVQVTERLNLNGWRGDCFQQKPLSLGNRVNWVGWDLHPAFTYDVIKEGPVDLSVGGGWDVVLFQPSYSESRPNLQFNLSGSLGPVSLDLQNLFEMRMIQFVDKKKRYRWSPRLKASAAQSLTPLNLTPYVFWEGFFQKKMAPIYLLDSYRKPIVSFYNAIEVGTMARLSKDIGLGLADQFLFIPTRTETGYNRITTYLTWYFDAVNP